jgi:hypothetical protein
MDFENTWIFPALEALHVVGLALLVGTVVLANLRVLGWTVIAPPERLQHAGFWLMVLTGAAMLASDFDRYRANPAFLVKMVLVLVALSLRANTRTTAILSLALWTLAVLAARAVIDFDV